MNGVSKIFITSESGMFVLKITTLNKNFGLLTVLVGSGVSWFHHRMFLVLGNPSSLANWDDWSL